MKRRKVSGSGARALFKATASRTHKMNMRNVPMRGGFRI